MDTQQIKQNLGTHAVEHYVESGMKLGLGTGSTAICAVRALGEAIAAGRLTGIKAVTTSLQTLGECERLGIPIFTLNSAAIGGELDLAIDGADEVDPDLNLIKGGGAAHLSEKIVEYASKRFIVIVDESKLVHHLALKFPLPVEVVPEARVSVSRALERLGGSVAIRSCGGKDGPIVTDHGNIVLDVLFSSPVDPARLETEIDLLPGVVEVGFFTRNHPLLLVGHADGTIETRR
jgi:ribose 5-phosphate isomerase A